ncbi:hypothetical protein M4D79_10905 [Mycolicibacterium novocastrense]|nr:hypothetical protein M4D79_10905 [Mycolicibacterium novocastrense]
MSLRLGPLVVDAADPPALSTFWAAVLGVDTQRPLLVFRPQDRPKTVKNRVHVDLDVRDIAALLDLGARVLAEYPGWTTLADIEGNEFCAFPESGMEALPPACSPSARTATAPKSSPPGGRRGWGPSCATDPTGRRGGSTGHPAGRTSSGSSSASTTAVSFRTAGGGASTRPPTG